MEPLMGNEVETNKHYTQVYQATHEGEQRLPFMRRSFISFSFGDKLIEDFNLIVTTVNDSLDREGYAPINDITTEYDNLNGQKYWGTHYKASSLEFTLATDGMDQKTLDDFLHWFQAGTTKELVLAEHPNRGILARIAEAPHLDLLPFEGTVNMVVSNVSYPVTTTLYKGSIILKFVMDQPHWYSLTNILGKKQNDKYIDYWDDPNGNEVFIFASKDALKILYEDGIPLGSMIQSNMLLGNRAFANVEDNTISKIWSIANDADIIWTEGVPSGEGARIEANNAVYPYLMGVIAGAIINADGTGISSLGAGANGYFYYSGTAPAPTIISFTMTPPIPANDNGYITAPTNAYAKKNNKSYDTLTIESVTKSELDFTTPNLYTSFNKVLQIFTDEVKTNTLNTWEDIRQLLREEVRHPHVRAWANKVLDELPASSTNITTQGLSNTLKTNMWVFLKDGNGDIQPATFTFNSETGVAMGQFKYRLVSAPNQLATMIEDVGDMLRSNYIIIRDRNYPDAQQGIITAWTEAHKEYSHRIYHNARVPLTNLQVEYKNMYL